MGRLSGSGTGDYQVSKFSGLRKQSVTDISATQNAKILEVSESRIKTGRPRAKRSDPRFAQVTAYILRDTHVAAKKRLLDEGQEFSELLQQLLNQWLEKQ